jgi:hypothetical protein
MAKKPTFQGHLFPRPQGNEVRWSSKRWFFSPFNHLTQLVARENVIRHKPYSTFSCRVAGRTVIHTHSPWLVQPYCSHFCRFLTILTTMSEFKSDKPSWLPERATLHMRASQRDRYKTKFRPLSSSSVCTAAGQKKHSAGECITTVAHELALSMLLLFSPLHTDGLKVSGEKMLYLK